MMRGRIDADSLIITEIDSAIWNRPNALIEKVIINM
jgi:hypothetical protein